MERPSIPVGLFRGLRGWCPFCGKGRLFRRWHHVHESCARCGCEFKGREGDCWGFMYMSMALLVGLMVIVMLLVKPPNLVVGQAVTLLVAGLVLFLSLPLRKGLAMAIDILVDPERDVASGDRNPSREARTEP